MKELLSQTYIDGKLDKYKTLSYVSTQIGKTHKVKEITKVMFYQPECSFSEALIIQFIGKKKLKYKILDLLRIKY